MNEQKKQKLLFDHALACGVVNRELAGEIASAVLNKMKDGHMSISTQEALKLVEEIAKEGRK